MWLIKNKISLTIELVTALAVSLFVFCLVVGLWPVLGAYTMPLVLTIGIIFYQLGYARLSFSSILLVHLYLDLILPQAVPQFLITFLLAVLFYIVVVEPYVSHDSVATRLITTLVGILLWQGVHLAVTMLSLFISGSNSQIISWTVLPKQIFVSLVVWLLAELIQLATQRRSRFGLFA